MPSSELLTIAARFHEAAFDGAWLPALAALAEATGSNRGQLIGIGGPDFVPFNLVTNLAEQALDDFIAIDGGDPGVNWRVAATGVVAPMAVAWERDYDDVRPRLTTRIYDDFADSYDIPYGCQTELVSRSGVMIGLAVLRSRADGPSTEAARALMGEVAPHVRDAVMLAMMLEEQGPRLVAGALEAMSITAFVCDIQGDVRAMTASAEALVGQAGPLGVAQSRLTGAAPGDGAALDRALAVAVSTGVGATLVVGRPAAPLMVSIVALPKRAWNFRFAPAALAIVRAPRAGGTLAAELLRALYGLTQSEAEVACAFLDGRSRDAIARERQVSLATVQSQMKAIFQKVGVNREADLAIRLASLAGPA